jgi:hypothetical protein
MRLMARCLWVDTAAQIVGVRVRMLQVHDVLLQVPFSCIETREVEGAAGAPQFGRVRRWQSQFRRA